jgi:hypothetical protein
MPAGRVCDLHVRDAVGIGGDHGIEVVDIDGEMVEVAEQREVRHAALPCDSVDHIDDLGGGAQRVARRPAQRLEEHRAADPGGRPAGEGEVLDGQRILRLGCRVLHPVAVERVEPTTAQPHPDTNGDVEVVAELGAAGRPGHEPAVTAGHVAGEEVQPDQRDSGIGDRADERVDVAIGRHPRPGTATRTRPR